jgi:DNA ligase-1|tara:strand:+ start:3601 stop:5268 length:1668 start_codon:yes stop_codon:yes gene_type:complete
MDYSVLTKTYEELESTTKRLEKTKTISELLKKTKEKELEKVIYLLQGKVFPKWDERKIGMSSRLVLKAINLSTGVSINKLEKEWTKKGDLGIVVEEQIKKSKQTSLFKTKLTIEKVFSNIQKLAELEGKGTVTKKIQLITELLTSAKPEEARFIARTVIEDLRIGVQDGVIRDSIAKAFSKEIKEIENAYNLTNDFAEVAIAAKKNKLKLLEMQTGKPINPMLAIKSETIEDAFKALGTPILAEYKLDGFRLQIHKKGDEIKLFTRRLENVTNQFKEILPTIKSHIKEKECILDSELVGFNPKTNNYLPFQHISQRIRRKYDIEKKSEELPVEINVFDIISKNKKPLLNETQEGRRKILEKIIKQEKHKIVLTKKLVTKNKKEIEKFYKESLKKGNEGIMLKNLEAKYVPGRRVGGWLKIKPTKETLDLVITGANWGEGKRVKWLASFTVACRDKNKFLTIGKVGTGIAEKDSDLTFEKLTKELKPLIKEQKGKHVTLKPKIVLEIIYEEIQKSPTYSSGFALRFPRVVRLRPDRSASSIDKLERINLIYKKQNK